ncbi:MAG: lipid-A-disaccharide synthase [Bacteroidales bacterium]|jgi:lipid-A-disaccharide synthase
MKYYIVAGEPSGDLHGSNLIRHLKKTDKHAEFRGFGGDLMKAAGATLSLHYKTMSFIGIWEIVRNIRTINKTMDYCRDDISKYRPDAIILIDYPGFNLKIAEFGKKQGYKILYYIAPKVWASRKSRVKRMRKFIDKLFVILPFEEKYFNDLNIDAEYTGNPLTDAIAAFTPAPDSRFYKENGLSASEPVIALLAGSRKTEIYHCLPEMIKACKDLTGYQLVLAGAPSIPPEYYREFTDNTGIKVIYNQTYDLLHRAKAAVVTSGTATLETALFEVPEVVIYKLSTPTYIIGRPFFRIRFFSLVNIIMGREVVKELLQFHLARDIRKELERILTDSGYRKKMVNEFRTLKQMVGEAGASEKFAKSMYTYLTQ